VLASAAGRRPRAPAERAWIWGCEGRLDDAAATAAVLDGAYDVVALGAADAADRLAARAHELAAAVPPVAPSSDVVARSAAARRMLAQAAHGHPADGFSRLEEHAVPKLLRSISRDELLHHHLAGADQRRRAGEQLLQLGT